MKIQMDEEWRKRWLAALRSGKYKQHRQALRKFTPTDSFKYQHCCLGVLCDISGLGEFKDSTSPRFMTKLGDASSTNLPMSVASTTKLFITAQNYLINLNDMHGNTFAEIADVIERGAADEPL